MVKQRTTKVKCATCKGTGFLWSPQGTVTCKVCASRGFYLVTGYKPVKSK